MKIIVTLSFVLLTIVGMAQSISLTVFNNDGQQFFVIMNGIRQNSLPQTNVKIGGMTTGSYALKLIFADGKTADIKKNIFLDVAGDYVARVKFKKNKGKLQWFGVSNGTQQVPAGGNAVEYRPNEESIYSDQPQPIVIPPVQQPATTPPVQQNTNGTYNQTQPAGSVYGQTNGQGTVTTTTTVTDPNGQTGQIGQGGMNITINVQDPASGTGGISTSTTVTDPNNPGMNTGMNTNVVIQGTPTTGNTTVPPSIEQNPTTFGAPVTIPDPNIPTGFGIHINADGSMPAGATSTSTSTTTSSTTVNGQTTTQQTTTILQNGQAVTTTSQTSETGTEMTGDDYTVQQTVNDPSGVPMCTEVLTNADGLMKDIDSETFEQDKRELIEFRLKNTCLTADQAFRIINSMTFEADKLDLSKFLYVHLTDKVNGYRLLELLEFDSSKKELKQFMDKH